MALSRRLPRVGVTHHLALWSPDLPRRRSPHDDAVARPARPRDQDRGDWRGGGRGIHDQGPAEWGRGGAGGGVPAQPGAPGAVGPGPAGVASTPTTAQETEVARNLMATADGRSYLYLIWHGDTVVGRVMLTNIVRGVLQSGTVGYWVDHEHLGRGLATSGVGHVVVAGREARPAPPRGRDDARQRRVAGGAAAQRLPAVRRRRAASSSSAASGATTCSSSASCTTTRPGIPCPDRSVEGA